MNDTEENEQITSCISFPLVTLKHDHMYEPKDKAF